MKIHQPKQWLCVVFYMGVLPLKTTASPISTRDGNHATKQWHFKEIPPCVNLTWYPCRTAFQCAYLDVPLDYSKPSGSRASIPLIKLPAETNSPNGSYKGMILTNPGGPGGSGLSFIYNTGAVIRAVTGTNWDLVSWDPRGIGQALPSANCSAGLPSYPYPKRSVLPKIYGPEFADIFWEQQFQQAHEEGENCQALIGGQDDAGPHMSTAVNVRDMISILDAYSQSPESAGVSKPSMLNYWGISYGTFIGESFASMFPDRVGRVVLDGVVDPEAYSSGSYARDLTFTDDVLSTFFFYCNLAGPTLCPVYTGNTALDIYNRFEKSFSQLDAINAAAQNWSNATAIQQTLFTVKNGVFNFLYDPIFAFPALAHYWTIYEAGIAAGLSANDIEAPIPVSSEELWFPAVACPDSGGASFNLTKIDLQPYIDEVESLSLIAGEVIGRDTVVCTGWSIAADETFRGPFGGRTTNPILFVSNTLDPITPITNGQKAFPKYKGAELLTIEGQGHSSQAAQNSCADAKIGAFFQTGSLPGKENFCHQEAGAFGVTLPENLQKRDDWNFITAKMQGLKKRMKS